MLLVVFNPLLLTNRGMESALFVLLTSAALFATCVLDRPAVTGVLLGLLILVRPDGIVLLVFVVAAHLWWKRSLPVSLVVASAMTVAPWVLFSWIAIGSPIPGTLAAKMAQGRSQYFGDFSGSFTFLRSAVRSLGTEPWLQLLGAAAVVGTLLSWRTRALRTYIFLLLGSSGVLFLAYAILIRPPDYPWYYAPHYYTLSVLGGLGFADLGSLVAGRRHRTSIPVRAVIAIGIIATVVMGLLSVARGYPYTGYDTLSAWLDSHTARSATVAATEIGVLGWRSDREVVDYLGLLTDRSAADVERGDYRSWIDREQPDYFVMHLPAFAIESIPMSTKWFAHGYSPVLEITKAPQASRVRLFKRVRTKAQAEGGSEPSLVTEYLLESLERSGVTLDARGQQAVNALLAVFLADSGLQTRFEGRDGVDFKGLVRWASEAARQGDPRLARYSNALSHIARQATALAELVTPLAPEVTQR
jgi:hypothetical protein